MWCVIVSKSASVAVVKLDGGEAMLMRLIESVIDECQIVADVWLNYQIVIVPEPKAW